MNNNNERLAAIIAEKLKEKGLIKSDDTSVESELAKGKLKETAWKIALEEVLNSNGEEANETTEENATE
ncbi:hypothetical protein P0M11_12465 [Kaistella sp. PBT33-4]|uniref:hypothetical protein n=1 Tax=Kaistella sp. PBT33-4 TaxID=3032000 RepID=UPI0023D8BBBD|nr:hypothetical protein [Kaistella sp. PBT33-4]MDF0720813.1 hypothetical protein [Kaistella sp. PBT33-4]